MLRVVYTLYQQVMYGADHLTFYPLFILSLEMVSTALFHVTLLLMSSLPSTQALISWLTDRSILLQEIFRVVYA